MAGTIHDYKSNEVTYHEGQPNAVLSVTEVRTYAVRFTNSEGKELMCLVDTFGKMKDGGLGVFVKANTRQMTENLREVPPAQLESIRQQIASLAPGTVDDLPGVNSGIADALDDVVANGGQDEA